MSIISLNTVIKTVGLGTTGTATAVEERKLSPHYISAERTLRRILGDTLFARVVAAAATPASDVPADDLIEDYITGFLSWFTYKRSLPGLAAEPSRNGIHYKNDANTVQADKSDKDNLKGVAEDTCDEYQSDLIAFLDNDACATTPVFPEYKTDTGSANDDERYAARQTFAGIVTPRNYRKRPRGQRWDENGYPHED